MAPPNTPAQDYLGISPVICTEEQEQDQKGDCEEDSAFKEACELRTILESFSLKDKDPTPPLEPPPPEVEDFSDDEEQVSIIPFDIFAEGTFCGDDSAFDLPLPEIIDEMVY